jgi:hypothetical protein
MGQFSFFLFARPSFVEGAARVLDIGDTLNHYNTSPTEADADYNALFADWCAVGSDLGAAMGRIAGEQANQGKTAKTRIGSRKKAGRC